MDKGIEHSGIITRLDHGNAYVRIVQHSACSACHAKGACSAADRQDKEIVVPNITDTFQVGDTVLIYGKSSSGLLAVLFAFVIPFLLILLSLLVLNNKVENEAVMALFAIGVLVPYYLILAFFNKKLSRKLRFYIEPIHSETN